MREKEAIGQSGKACKKRAIKPLKETKLIHKPALDRTGFDVRNKFGIIINKNRDQHILRRNENALTTVYSNY